MPVKVEKTDGSYRVSTPHGTKAKHTTKAKAKAQERLLNAVEHGWKPGKKKKHHSASEGSFLENLKSEFGVE